MGLATNYVAYAIAQGKLTQVGKDVFLGRKAAIPSLPSDVGPYTNVVETGGAEGILTHDSRYPRPSIQVSVVAAASSVAEAKARLLHAFSCNLHNVTLNSQFYLKITAVQEVSDMSPDAIGRAKWGFNLISEQT